MKETILGIVGASALTMGAFAQSVQTAAPTTKPVDSFLKLNDFSFDENINFFNLSTGNVTQFAQKLNWQTPVKDLTTSLTLPVYTDGTTGAGMLDLGADWKFVNKPFSFMDSADLTLDIKLPTSSAGYGGNSVNVVLGTKTKGETFIDKLSWGAGMNWEFNANGDYIPVFGGFTTQDIMNVNADLAYNIVEKLDLAVNYNFWYLDSGDSLSTIGPALNWDICPNANLNFGVDVPFDQYAGSPLDLIVRFGGSVKF
jgi:hypothetical protein